MDDDFWYDGDGRIRNGIDGVPIANLVCWTDLLYLWNDPSAASEQLDRIGRLFAKAVDMRNLLKVIHEKYELDEDSEIAGLLSEIEGAHA